MYVEVKLAPSETKRGFSKTGYVCAIILKGHFQISRAQSSAVVWDSVRVHWLTNDDICWLLGKEILTAISLEGANKKFWRFEATFFSDIKLRKSTSKSILPTLQIFTPWKQQAQGITGCLQVFPALSMEKGCNNHRETLCMLWVNPVIFTDCGETPW